VRALLVAAGVGLCWLLGLTRLLIATSGGTAAAADDSMDARSRRHKASAAPAPQGIIAASAPSPPPLSPSTPFVLNFESSSGSSWLIQELAAHPQACTVLFEPIDNISLASAEDHRARLRWLEILWTPPGPAAPPDAWAAWRAHLEAASVFGQRPLIRQSLRRCSGGGASVAFGLKARLSRLLSHPAVLGELRALMARRGVHVIRLSRRNRIKQALAEYRRLHAGLGQFRAAADASEGRGAAAPSVASPSVASPLVASPSVATPRSATPAVAVDLPLFRESLRAVERSHRLAERVLAALPPEPRLTLDYEQLLGAHEATLERVRAFLRLAPPPPPTAADAAAGIRTFVKATPDKLCAAVSNYGELCAAYAAGGAGEYAPFFDEPCGCGAPEGGAALPVPRSGVAGVEEQRKGEGEGVKRTGEGVKSRTRRRRARGAPAAAPAVTT
jgi:hypothetical protein